MGSKWIKARNFREKVVQKPAHLGFKNPDQHIFEGIAKCFEKSGTLSFKLAMGKASILGGHLKTILRVFFTLLEILL